MSEFDGSHGNDGSVREKPYHGNFIANFMSLGYISVLWTVAGLISFALRITVNIFYE